MRHHDRQRVLMWLAILAGVVAVAFVLLGSPWF